MMDMVQCHSGKPLRLPTADPTELPLKFAQRKSSSLSVRFNADTLKGCRSLEGPNCQYAPKAGRHQTEKLKGCRCLVRSRKQARRRKAAKVQLPRVEAYVKHGAWASFGRAQTLTGPWQGTSSLELSSEVMALQLFEGRVMSEIFVKCVSCTPVISCGRMLHRSHSEPSLNDRD